MSPPSIPPVEKDMFSVGRAFKFNKIDIDVFWIPFPFEIRQNTSPRAFS
jgi:hypothetical protein